MDDGKSLNVPKTRQQPQPPKTLPLLTFIPTTVVSLQVKAGRAYLSSHAPIGREAEDTDNVSSLLRYRAGLIRLLREFLAALLEEGGRSRGEGGREDETKGQNFKNLFIYLCIYVFVYFYCCLVDVQYYMNFRCTHSDSQFLKVIFHLYYCKILAIFPALYNISL